MQDGDLQSPRWSWRARVPDRVLKPAAVRHGPLDEVAQDRGHLARNRVLDLSAVVGTPGGVVLTARRRNDLPSSDAKGAEHGRSPTGAVRWRPCPVCGARVRSAKRSWSRMTCSRPATLMVQERAPGPTCMCRAAPGACADRRLRGRLKPPRLPPPSSPPFLPSSGPP